MLKKTNPIVDKLRKIMALYWAMPLNKLIAVKEEHPIYYAELIKQGINFDRLKSDSRAIDYIDIIIIAERILDNPAVMKILKYGNTSILTEDFMAFYFFKLCREKLSESKELATSHEVINVIDQLFNIDLYTKTKDELRLEYLEMIKDPLELSKQFDLPGPIKFQLFGALQHCRWLILMKINGYRLTDWVDYITNRGIYKTFEGQFDPRKTCGEIGYIYYSQLVLDGLHD